MEAWILNILFVVSAFLLMEFVAWFTHKYVMHGVLWSLHKDHHQPHKDRFFERNDFFFLIYACPGMLLLYFGNEKSEPPFWFGLGITLYGLAYFLIHDLFIHQRIKILRNSKLKYLKALRKAHKVHHKNRFKEDGECFGMLIVPFGFFKESKQHTKK
jgi:beta-carotene 3-hydroxylase